jgi:adenosylcobinamide-GDP ribazoletransferase
VARRRFRSSVLAIMRDSRVGAYRVASVKLILIVEAGALAAVAAAHRIAEIAVAFALSRAVAPAIAASLPYARPGAGVARALASGGRLRALFAALVAVSLVVLLDARRGWALLACAAGCGLAGGVFFRRRFGGMTGDTLGAAIAVTEALCLVVSSAR